MAFRDVNQKKLAYLLTQGTHEGELKKFFGESRAQLIMKGARVQNLPQGREERIRTICERLPPRTNDTLRWWFHKNISVSDPMPLSDVLMYLEFKFDADEAIPEADARLAARSALTYLFEDEPDQSLLSFLKRAPGAQPTQLVEIEANPASTPTGTDGSLGAATDLAAEEPPPPQRYQLSELLASIVANDESAIDNALVPFPQHTRTLVEALLRARDGDVDAANEQLALLNPEAPESELVQRALNRARHQRGTNSTPTGIRVVSPQRLTGHPETGSYEIIGICTNESDTGAIFVQPAVLVLDRKLHLLSLEDRVFLFPESGDVMTHKSALRRSPQRRELVRWKVAERESSGGRTRYHLESELNPLIEVIQVSVPSSDPDEVRERIKTMVSSSRPSPGQQTVFLLSDGVAVASPKGADIMRDEAYDQPWQAWNSLETWLIEGRQYCLDLVQGAASNLDLSPLDAAFKRLLKNLEAEQKSTLNKAQKRELADIFRSRSAGDASLRVRRIVAFLDQIAIDGEELDFVLSLLNSREEVHRRVEQLVVKEFDERQAERSGLQAEIDALKRKKLDLARESKELERNIKKLADSVADSAKDAFSRAVDEGVTTLANAEVFRMLVGSTASAPAQSPAATSTDSVQLWTVRGALTLPEVKARLVSLGLNGRQAIVLAELAALAMRSGVGLVLKGRDARQYVQALIRLDSETSGIIEIPMGLTSGASMRRALDSMSDVHRLAILNADLSPLEVYGARLLDSIFESVLDCQGGMKSLVFSCLGSDMSLPLPNLQRVAVTVDLDTAWDEGGRTLEEIEVDSIPLLAALRSRIVSGLTSLDGNGREQLERALVKVLAPEE